MSEKDLNKIAKFEKAIKEKYGESAIQNPKSSWNEEKEKKYLADLKKFYSNEKTNKTYTDKDGFTVKETKRKSASSSSRNCPVCSSYSFSLEDDLYMTKYECCFECYIKFVEGREERWKTGWRPNN